jgi:hypothetical protein
MAEEQLLSTAIVGTAQSGNSDLQTGTALDELIQHLPVDDKERRILLAAAAWGAYRQAGQCASSVSSLPASAPEEPASMSVLARTYVLELLLEKRDDDLLLEALRRMQKHHRYLPYKLLPHIMDWGQKDKARRDILIAVMGERGRWLSQFNKNWSWADVRYLEGEQLGREQVETIWQEGKLTERVVVLKWLREHEPELARQWLEMAWKKEKAEARSSLLKQFAINLTMTDELFLEQALDDRSEIVRADAALLLGLLPESAFVQRMRTRADALLRFTDGELIIPSSCETDTSWVRDSLIDRLGVTDGNRADVYGRIFAALPLAYWEERFQLTPYELLEMVSAPVWLDRLFQAWVRRAISEQNHTWMQGLVAWYQAHTEKHSPGFYAAFMQLLLHLPAEQSERLLLTMLNDKSSLYWEVTSSLKDIWSPTLITASLQRAHELLQVTFNEYEDRDVLSAVASWLMNVARKFPDASINTISLDGWDLPELPDTLDYRARYVYSQIASQIQNFLEIMHIRKRLIEEIGSL